jgi:hypothetical protein
VINSLDTKNSKDSKLTDQDTTDKKYLDTDVEREKESNKCDKQEKNEKNINIKLNINSEVINNNIKIRDSNDMSSFKNLNGISSGINCINGISSGSNQNNSSKESLVKNFRFSYKIIFKF